MKKYCFLFYYLISLVSYHSKATGIEKTDMAQQEFVKKCLIATPKSNLYKNIVQCRKNKIINSSSDLCQNPIKWMCANMNNDKLNPDCSVSLHQERDVKQLPNAINFLCNKKFIQQDFKKNPYKYCPNIYKILDKLTNKKSKEEIALLCARESKTIIHNILIKLIYTTARTVKLTKLFNIAKTNILNFITNSSHITMLAKETLKKRLQNFQIALTNSDILSSFPPDCYTTGSNDIRNKTLKNSFNLQMTSQQDLHKIYVCSGRMFNLDYENRDKTIFFLTHELSHVIDPCNLELNTKMLPVYINKMVYPNILSCLRGGSGFRKCKNSIIKCNSNHLKLVKINHIDCPMDNKGQISYGYSKTNSSETYDQSEEAFADYMAASITGQYILNKSSISRGRNLLFSLASYFKKIASDDHQKNCTNLINKGFGHPPGFLRMNRIIMSSNVFRKSVGCQKQIISPEAVTCPNLD